jgi:RNA polymerase sigma factor (sigma-70 family)
MLFRGLFFAVIVNLDKYQVGTNFKAWLYKLALNICRGYLRKRRARESMQRSLWNIQSSAGSVEQTALQRESISDLWSAVDRLKDRHRLALPARMATSYQVRIIGLTQGFFQAKSMGLSETWVFCREHFLSKHLRWNTLMLDKAKRFLF